MYKNEENKIYIDSIKEIIGENKINYYQFFSFVNLLYNQLKHLNQNYHLNPRLINDQANLKIKNWMIQYVYELLIELVKKFFFPSEYKEINRKEIYDEYSEITEKKQISNYINILNKLSTNDFIKYIIIFNKDGQSLTIINNNNKEVNTKLKQIWNFENLSTKENLKDYNNLNSIEFNDEIKKYFNINETIKSKKINGLKDFVFITDNFIKLILIDINMESNIPIVLVGETGIGKTYIILEICLILNIKLKKLNIHAGINENDVINFMNKNVLNQNKTQEIWVFFDEINTSHVIHLISEMMCNRTIKGIKLNNNIKFIASCNPYRIKRGLKDIYGLENKEIKNNKINNRFLDYNVYPIPFSLLPLLTVRENVCLPMEMQGIPENEARIKAAEALVKVGIEESKHKRFPSALSGGEQQRVAIARSLCSGAPVLLADEPTGNLDGENTRIVMEILRRLAHEEGRCVIVVTHDPEVADTADMVLRMKDGVLTEN